MKMQQTDIFSLFGIEDDSAPKVVKIEDNSSKSLKKVEGLLKEESALKNAPSKPTPTNNSKTPAPDKFEVKIDTLIRYAGMELPVTTYFSQEQLENGIAKKKKDDEVEYKPIDEEALRKKLEEDYPELVKGFTSLVYIQKKNIIVPILQAKKKGTNACEDSSYEGSLQYDETRIPFSILSDFVAIAKQFSTQFGTEIHADIYYDYSSNDFFMDFPHQRASAFLVEVIECPSSIAMRFLDKSYSKIMEIHSHHILSATPSVIDNENEVSSILYTIVGRINSFFPDIRVRRFDKKHQRHINLELNQVFQEPFVHQPTKYDLSFVEISS